MLRHDGHGEQDTCTGQQGGLRQEKSNLRVSDCVASPCCKLLISPNLARAWELAPIPHNPASPPACPAHVSSNPTRRDLSLPTLFNNERYLGAQQPLSGQCCCLAASGHIQLRGWSRTLGADYLIARPMSRHDMRPDRRMRRSHRGGTVRACIQQSTVMPSRRVHCPPLMSVTGVGLVDVV